MSKNAMQHNDSPSTENETDLVSLIKKIQNQLTFLEKKIDTLINRSSERQFEKKDFSRPYKPFNRPRPHDNRKYDGRSQGNQYSQRHPFDKNQTGENRGYGQRKKPFFRKQKEQA